MCGLGGVAMTGGAALDADTSDGLTTMARLLQHRGPDNSRLLCREGEQVGFAFTRLSIVDADGGDQPLESPDGRLSLIANGEVYNYKELISKRGLPMRTGSDSEVLLHLYERDGLSFLDDVRGIFAVVMYDRRRRELVLARDRFGIKPLYYRRLGRRVLFSSEIKALATPAHPLRIAWDACLEEEMLTNDPAPNDSPPPTWFSGVHAVPAGTVLRLRLDTGELEQHEYWRVPDFTPREGAGDEAAFIDAYLDLLTDSVRESCMGEAEIGLLLSGGVDSAAVAHLATPPGPFHTFTTLAASTLGNGDAEGAFRTAGALGLDHHLVAFPDGDAPDPEGYRRLLWLVENPLCGAEQYYKYELYRYAKQVRPGLKVMLLGQASDEYNGGYTTLLAMGQGWDRVGESLRELQRRRRLATRPTLHRWFQGVPLLSDDVLGDLRDPYAEFVAKKTRDIQSYNLWHEDRTAAGNGVESRVPFLDHRLIELSAQIPAGLHSALIWDKRILRRAMRKSLPRDITDRPKVSHWYGVGAHHTHRAFLQMLAADSAALLEEAVTWRGAQGYLDASGMRKALRQMLENPSAGHPEVLLRLVNLSLLDKFGAEAPPALGRPSAVGIKQSVSVFGPWDVQSVSAAGRLLPTPP